MGDLLAFLFVGPGAFLLAGGLAYLVGRSPGRMVLVVAVGLAAIAGFLFLSWSDSASTPEDCWECGEILGRWMNGVFVFFLLVNAVTWPAGAVVGWAIRRSPSHDRPAGRAH